MDLCNARPMRVRPRRTDCRGSSYRPIRMATTETEALTRSPAFGG